MPRVEAGRLLRGSAAIAALAATVLLVGLSSSAFGAGAPLILLTNSEKVETNQANLKARVDANGAPTTFYFEYTTQAAFDEHGFTGAIRAPAEGEKALAPKNQNASEHIDGLQPSSAYRFHIVATNEFGPTVGPTRLLTTDDRAPKFSLPDLRGWEMVSPIDKNGGQIDKPEADYGGGDFQAAAQGGAVTYSSLDSFAGGLGSPGASQYLSLRGGSAWTTENLTVSQFSGGYDTSPGAGSPYRLFSENLGLGISTNGRRCRGEGTGCPVANLPLPGSGAPSGYRNFYLRDNADGTYKALLTSADLDGGLGSDKFEVAVAAATPDLSRVILSTCAALTEDAIEVPGTEGECDPTEPNLYLYSAASGLTLVNLPPGEIQGAPGAMIAAQGGAISTDGSRVYWTDGDELFLRNGDATVPVDDEEEKGAEFQVASRDGTVAYYTRGGHLFKFTVDGGPAQDLTPAGSAQGVLGASTDGAVVYYQTAAGIFRNEGGIDTPVSGPADASNFPPATGTARVSGDGQTLAFVSSTDLTEFDSNGTPEVYLYTADDGLDCVSCNRSGEVPVGPSGIPGAFANGDAFSAYKPRVLSTGGTRLFFDSDDTLVTVDTNRHGDVYEWEADGTGSCTKPAGCLGLISSGDEAIASFVDASADGSDVYFNTDGSLVPTDPGSADIYDARVSGGFPVPEPPIVCVGDSCQSLPPEPEDPTPGTILEGIGNQPLRNPPKAKPKKKKHRHAKGKRHHRSHVKRSNHSGGVK